MTEDQPQLRILPHEESDISIEILKRECNLSKENIDVYIDFNC